MSASQVYSTMERSELEALRADRISRLERIQKEIRKLKKKYRSGFYDRQVICEYILGYQAQTTALIATIDGINQVLKQELATA